MSVADEDGLVGYQEITVHYTEWGEYKYYATFLCSFGYRGKPTNDTTLILEKIWADGICIYDRVGEVWTDGVNGWYYKQGTEDQTPIAAGALAYRGQILLWFSKMDLTDYGNQIPAISAEFSEGTLTLETALTTFAIRAGYAEVDIITENIPAVNLIGYIIGQSATLESITAGLSMLYNFSVVEIAGQVNFIGHYLAGEVVIATTITEDMLAVLSESGDLQQLITTERQSDDSYPRKITATYFDVNKSFEAGSQTAERDTVVGTNTSLREVNLSLPIVDTGANIRSLLHDALYRAWSSKNAHTIRLPQEFIKYNPGEVFRVVVYGATYDALVEQHTINGDFSVSASMSELAATYALSDIETQPVVPRPPIVRRGPVRAVLLDIPDIVGTQTAPEVCNLYVAVGASAPGTWVGARLDLTYMANPSAWSPRMLFATEVGISDVLNALWEPVTNTEVLDAVNALDVLLVNMDVAKFQDATEAALDDGVTNLIAVGGIGRYELMQFTTVTPGVAGHVTLTGLRRGLYGTEVYVNSHLANDTLIFTADTSQLTYPASDYRAHRDMLARAVPIGGTAANATVVPVRLQGNSRKPMAPINLAAERLDNGDVRFTWGRRARYFQTPLAGLGQPLDETEETYEIEVWDDDWLRVIRKNKHMHTPEYTYYIEEQIIDGNNTDTEFHVFVWQMNGSHVGRGFTGGGTVAEQAVVTLAGRAGPILPVLGHLEGMAEGTVGPIVAASGALSVPASLRATVGPLRSARAILNRSDLSGRSGPLVGPTGVMDAYEYAPPMFMTWEEETEDTPVTTFTIIAPDGIVVGDLLVAWITIDTAATITRSGWTLEENAGAPGIGNAAMLSRFADAGDAAAANFAFTFSVAASGSGIMVRIANADAITSTTVDVNVVGSTSHTAEVQAVGANSLLLYAVTGNTDITPTDDNTIVAIPEGTNAPGIAATWELSPDGDPQSSTFTSPASTFTSRFGMAIVGNTVLAGPNSPHLFWRLNVALNNFAGVIQARELEFRYQGTNLAVGGTATASTGTAADAFNGVPSDSGWTTATADDEWIAYEFPTPVRIDEFGYREAGNQTRTPRDWTIEFSDDGVTWVVHTTFVTTIGASYASEAWTYWKLDNYSVNLSGNSGPIVGATGVTTGALEGIGIGTDAVLIGTDKVVIG